MGALLFHPEFYKVAVSYAGCHDNRMDKIDWNEQWLGWPVDASYLAASGVVHADKLQGKLLLVVNASRKEVDYEYISGRLPASVRLEPQPDRALLALQGPEAAAVLAKHCADAVALGFMAARPASVGPFACHISRSGYTGEDGFEISVAADQVVDFARLLLADHRHIPHFIYSKPVTVTVTKRQESVDAASLVKAGVEILEPRRGAVLQAGRDGVVAVRDGRAVVRRGDRGHDLGVDGGVVVGGEVLHPPILPPRRRAGRRPGHLER